MESENETFNLEDLPTFLIYVLDKVELVCREQTTDLSKLESHLIVVDKVVGLLRELSLPGVYAILKTNDLEHLKTLSDVFTDILSAMQQLVSTLSVTPATVAENVCVTDRRNPGSNNLAETVLTLFLEAIDNDSGLWPSRIRVDRGVENVLVCEAMVMAREGRDSFIPGPSTHNQRIERLRRDVYRCVCHMYYYVFYGMEMSGILNPEDSMHLFALHLVYLLRINHALDEYKEAFDPHAVRTENNWTPYQMWLNGMMHERNPLVHSQLHDNPDDVEYYGYDPQ
ncbi:Hypothetical predicted protein, partial [Paramuricea clavata]